MAESVYGFYPGSASGASGASTSASARNDSLSEFFSPVGAGGTPTATPPLTVTVT